MSFKFELGQIVILDLSDIYVALPRGKVVGQISMIDGSNCYIVSIHERGNLSRIQCMEQELATAEEIQNRINAKLGYPEKTT